MKIEEQQEQQQEQEFEKKLQWISDINQNGERQCSQYQNKMSN